jgi:metal-responsive CopG/Arc/MetJ family transcriptional regulator
MKTIQVVVDEETLRAADREAKRTKVNRSELFRRAVRSYLQRAHAQALEDRHRTGYERHPETAEEFGGFEGTWPEE